MKYGWKPDLPDHRDYGYKITWPGKIPSHIDLRPGWQDGPNPYVSAYNEPSATIEPGNRRFALHVDLPMFGGSAIPAEKIHGQVEEATPRQIGQGAK